MRHTVAQARQQAMDTLIASISESSISFYQRAGFTVHNEWMECVLKGGI
jgi:hypothetical protein